MDIKTEKQIIFVLLIIIIALFFISQITPWAIMKYEEEEVSFYLWGAKFEPVFSNVGSTNSYVIYIFLLSNAIIKNYNIKTSSIYNINELEIMKDFTLGIFLLIISWVFTILVILCSILTFFYLYKVKEKQMGQGLKGIVIISIIAFLTFFVSFIFLFIPSLSAISLIESNFPIIINLNYEFSSGFHFFIIGIVIATVLNFVIFFIRFSDRLKSEKMKL